MFYLMGRYQMIETFVAILLFIPIFTLYYVIQGIPISPANIGLTTIFLGVFLVIKNVVTNYAIMVEQNRMTDVKVINE